MYGPCLVKELHHRSMNGFQRELQGHRGENRVDRISSPAFEEIYYCEFENGEFGDSH